jgi:hypothetical protein
MSHPGSQYRVPEHVLSRQAGGETIVLSMESERYFALDGAGPRVWQLLSEHGSTTADDLVAALAQEYAVDRSILDADVAAMLASLLQHGLIIEA